MKRRTTALAGLLGLALSLSALAQVPAAPSPAGAPGYPDRVIRVVIPYAAGGGGDAVFRMITDPLAASLGKPVLMDYHAGAGGTIGVELLARSAPDGYTIGVGSSDAVALAPNFYPRLGYDPAKDLQPIAIVAEMPLVLMVKADSPFTSLKDLLQAAKAKPGSVTYGTPGRGTSPHLMGELLARGAGVELVHVPYKGTAPALTDLFGGHVMAVVASGFDAVPLEKAGRVRTLSVSGNQRYPLLPKTPTIKEQGISGADDLLVWFGLFAPANIPRPVLDRLSREIDQIIAKPEFKTRAAELGFVPIRTTPDQFKTRVKADLASFSQMVKRTGITPE